MSVFEKCLFCGRNFEFKVRVGPRPRYCSSQCRWKQQRVDKKANISIERKCEYCSKPLNKVQKRFCSQDCFHLDSRTVKGRQRECANCGKLFETGSNPGSCCSSMCSRSLAAKTRNKERETVVRICVCCGESFLAKIYLGSVVSKRCERCAPALYRDKSRVRRLITQKQAKEQIVDADIYERDGWVCRICGELVNAGVSWPDPLSPSLDHIVPISLGGEHSLANVQLAHLGCNSRKGNKVDARASA